MISHNVSNTVNVRHDEWNDVADYIWQNRNAFTGVSLLAASGDKDFAFAPREAIINEADEARWNQILGSYEPINYEEMIEADDATDLKGEAACAGNACEWVS